MPLEPIQVMLEEYKQMSASLDKHATIGYSAAPPLIFLLAGMLAYVSKLDPNNQTSLTTTTPVLTLLIAFAVVLLINWICFSHALCCFIGLRLIRLEHRINKMVGATSLTYNTFLHGDGMKVIPGYFVYSVCSIAVVYLILLSSLVYGVYVACFVYPGLRFVLYVAGCLLAALLAVVPGITMSKMENRVRREKMAPEAIPPEVPEVGSAS